MIDSTPQILIDHLSKLGREKHVGKGEVLLFQEESVSHIGLVISGYFVATSCNENGTETWLGRFKSGDFFGHSAVFLGSKMQFEIKAENSAIIRLIPVSEIKSLIQDNPGLAIAFTKDLARRLEAMTLRLVESLTLSAKGRICAELMRMSKPIGISPGKFVIRPNPVFVDMALRVNSTRETVSRTISDLQKDEIISRQAGAIVIENPNELRAMIKAAG
jgi:CRP-like cAMP-binding protein